MSIRIAGFIWLDDVIDKLERKHGVTPDEAEEVFSEQVRVTRMNTGHFRGEDVYRALGKTEGGRYLAVFFVYKLSHEALILSARDMDRKERKTYGR